MYEASKAENECIYSVLLTRGLSCKELFYPFTIQDYFYKKNILHVHKIRNGYLKIAATKVKEWVHEILKGYETYFGIQFC